MKDKLMEKIEEVLKKSIDADTWEIYDLEKLKERLSTLLQSEISQERERLLKEAEEKVIGEDELFKKFTYPVPLESEVEIIKGYIANGRNELRAEQRKALSDIKEEGK